MIIAKTAEDFTYLPFANTRVNTSRFDVGGKRNNATGLDAFVYAERDIYSPGEKINFSVLLRIKQWKAPGEIPIIVKFLLPTGKELKSFRKTLMSKELWMEVLIFLMPLLQEPIQWKYIIQPCAFSHKNFMIEEFVPDRIKLTAKMDKPFLKPSETAVFTSVPLPISLARLQPTESTK